MDGQKKIVVATFKTEGSPFDLGEDLGEAEKRFRDSIEKYVDQYLVFTPRSLVKLDPKFEKCFEDYNSWLTNHPKRHELGNYNRSWSALGFQFWKPTLIQYLLKSHDLKHGDFLLYRDVNCIKYPSYLEGGAGVRDLSEKILKNLNCDVFIPSGFPLKKDVKADFIRRALGEKSFNETGVWVGVVLLRKSEESIRFVDEWYELSSCLDNLSPLPNPNPHPEFLWHAPEQATAGVLASLWRLQGKLPQDWPRYTFKNRAFRKEALVGSKWRSFLRSIRYCDFLQAWRVVNDKIS